MRNENKMVAGNNKNREEKILKALYFLLIGIKT
jgi:hypothetical protein